MIRWLRKNWLIVWRGSRWPYTQKGALVSAGGWVIALAAVALSIIADIITGSYTWLAWILVIGAFDSVMLYRTVRGLLWRRRVDKWRRGGAWRS